MKELRKIYRLVFHLEGIKMVEKKAISFSKNSQQRVPPGEFLIGLTLILERNLSGIILKMTGRKSALIVLGLSLFGGLYTVIYFKIEEQNVLKWPKKIVYKKGSSIFFIRDLKYKDAYLKYVYRDSIGEGYIVEFPFENSIGNGTTIYVRKYLKDSTLVEFYNREYHHRFWGFKTGYIHKSFIQDSIK